MPMPNPLRGLFTQQPGMPVSAPRGGAGFNPMAAGNKTYGAGLSAPNVGPTANRQGYAQRDAAGAARRDALLRRAGLYGQGPM